MSVIISYETDEKLDLNYEEIITNVVNGESSLLTFHTRQK